jgi:hypothetical protein
MINTKEHNFDDKEICKKCGYTRNQIEDKKITYCKEKVKITLNANKKLTTKKYI